MDDIYLYPLIRVRHHSNQQVNEHDDRDEHVGAEYDFEQVFRPLGPQVALRVNVVRRCLSKHGEEKPLERNYRSHWNWGRRV